MLKHAKSIRILIFFQNGLSWTETYLINTRKKTFEQLKPGPAKFCSGSVFKDDKVYIFGGSPDGNDSLNTCETYDLKKKSVDLNKLTTLCSYTRNSRPNWE